MTRIAIAGALGRMGTLIIQEAAKVKDMQLVAGLDAVGQERFSLAASSSKTRRRWSLS